MKPARCKVCMAEYQRLRPLQRVCGLACAVSEGQAKASKARAQEARAERRQDAAARMSIKPLRYFEKRAEEEVNRYVRLRDRHLGCCSCDKPASWPGRWNASHLRSVGAAPSIRFNLWNIAKACVQCNLDKSGNLGEYLPRATARMGQERIDWLYAQNAPVKRTREYLERLRSVFAKKCRRLEKRIKV